MKRLFKKNQIIVTTLAVMIAIAGYLNYSGKFFGEKIATETGSEVASQELLDISDEELTADAEEEIEDQEQEEEMEGTPGEAVLTSGVIAEAKVTREQVRAKNKETLLGIIDNQNISEEQKQDAVAQMVEMTKLTEKEAAIETMLASKGFKNAVVTLTSEGADVVVTNSELTDAHRAQIEDIITRKAEIVPSKIVITPVHEENTEEK